MCQMCLIGPPDVSYCGSCIKRTLIVLQCMTVTRGKDTGVNLAYDLFMDNNHIGKMWYNKLTKLFTWSPDESHPTNYTAVAHAFMSYMNIWRNFFHESNN